MSSLQKVYDDIKKMDKSIAEKLRTLRVRLADTDNDALDQKKIYNQSIKEVDEILKKWVKIVTSDIFDDAYNKLLLVLVTTKNRHADTSTLF